MRCTVDHIVITTGTQQSLDLIARLVLDPGDRVWVQDPGYAGAASLLRALGFAEAVAAARSILDRFPSVLEQATLCDFISAGHMEQHMRRVRELYAARFDALVRAVQRDLGGLLQLAPSQASLQTIAWLASDIDEDEACRRAAARGIDAVALSKLTIDRTMPPGLVLGVGSAHPRAIRRGIKELRNVLQEMSTRSRSAGRASYESGCAAAQDVDGYAASIEPCESIGAKSSGVTGAAMPRKAKPGRGIMRPHGAGVPARHNSSITE